MTYSDYVGDYQVINAHSVHAVSFMFISVRPYRLIFGKQRLVRVRPGSGHPETLDLYGHCGRTEGW